MDIKKFVLSYYKNATGDFHIIRINEPKGALELHSHDYFQIYYIRSGKILHHIEGSVAELAPGDVFILPPNVPHYIEKFADDVDFYSLSFMPDYFQSIKESNKLLLDFLYYLRTQSFKSIQPKFTLSYEDAVFVEMLVKRIMEEFAGEKAGKDELIKECVSVLLSIFARVYFEQRGQILIPEENRQLVMHSIEYIKNHFDEELTLSEIVHLSAMSKTRFCTLFNSIVGMSFKEYLNRYRIERAAELIADGGKISAAASCCGYGDFSTFYRNFKKYMGMSPAEFANKNRLKF
ncbi:MAG: helix-turn-helix domain-containing protein [Clostridia bacterium]|nr:helix-turn-helix domain-containing protein [Clostridia bacterium]